MILQRKTKICIKLKSNTKISKQKSMRKKKIYEKLRTKLKDLEQEKEFINKDHESQLNELYGYKKEVEKDNNYKELIIKNSIPANYLSIIEKMMDYDERQENWFIPKLPIFDIKNQKNENHNLAMGYNDDEELFQQNNPNMMNNDIQLSMILEMNNQKNVYLSYDNEKKGKKTGKTKSGNKVRTNG